MRNLFVTKLALSHDSQTIAASGTGRKISLFELPSGRKINDLLIGIESVTSLEFTPDDAGLLIGFDEEIKLLDLQKGTTKIECAGIRLEALKAAIFSPQGRYILVTDEQVAYVWNRSMGRVMHVFNEPDGYSTSTFSADENLVFIGDTGGAVFKGSLQREDDTEYFNVTAGYVSQVEVTRDTRFLITWDGGTVKMWDIATHRLIRSLGSVLFGENDEVGDDEEGPIHGYDGCLSNDETFVVSTGYSGGVFTLDIETGEVIHQFKGHESGRVAAGLTHDDKLLVTGGIDGSIRIWDVATGKEIRRIDNALA